MKICLINKNGVSRKIEIDHDHAPTYYREQKIRRSPSFKMKSFNDSIDDIMPKKYGTVISTIYERIGIIPKSGIPIYVEIERNNSI